MTESNPPDKLIAAPIGLRNKTNRAFSAAKMQASRFPKKNKQYIMTILDKPSLIPGIGINNERPASTKLSTIDNENSTPSRAILDTRFLMNLPHETETNRWNLTAQIGFVNFLKCTHSYLYL